MMRIKANVYHDRKFKEADGTLLVGNSWNGVIARVRLYRKQNNLPPGDPEAEVHAQACARMPSLCSETDGGVTIKAVRDSSLKTRVLAWFAGIRGHPQPMVDSAVAAQRATVCKQCPMNTALPEGCLACRHALAELRKAVLGSGRAGDAALTHRGCSVLGFEPATAVWIDSPTEPNAELPGFCWRKRTL